MGNIRLYMVVLLKMRTCVTVLVECYRDSLVCETHSDVFDCYSVCYDKRNLLIMSNIR